MSKFAPLNDHIEFDLQAVINMEWRSEYGVVIEFNPNLEARIDVPLLSFNKWGIYNHFFVEVEGDTVKIIPR